MTCWVLFKSCEECWYVFSRQVTWLGSDRKCQPVFCGLWLQHPLSVSLRCFSGPSCAQCEAWGVVCLLIHSSKSLIVGQDQIYNADQEWISPNVYEQLHCVEWVSLPGTFWLPEASLLCLLGKAGVTSYPILSYSFLTACILGQLTG